MLDLGICAAHVREVACRTERGGRKGGRGERFERRRRVCRNLAVVEKIVKVGRIESGDVEIEIHRVDGGSAEQGVDDIFVFAWVEKSAFLRENGRKKNVT